MLNISINSQKINRETRHEEKANRGGLDILPPFKKVIIYTSLQAENHLTHQNPIKKHKIICTSCTSR
jgi:hypothetical protein